MADDCRDIEEHELTGLEAVLACTLVLMTGYSQALQAEVHPQRRLAMGEKVASHLALLAGQPRLSPGFRQVLIGLQTRWHAIGACTRDAARDCADLPFPGPADEAFDRGPAQRKRLH